MTTSWLGNIPFSDEEESDKLNRQIDLLTTKAPKGPTTSSDIADANLTDAENTIKKNPKAIGVINALASNKRLIESAEGTDKRMGQSPSKGSVGRNYQTIKELQPQQPVTSNTEAAQQSVKGTTPYLNLPDLNIDYGAPGKGWDAGAALNMTPNELGALGANAGGKTGPFASAEQTASTLGGVSKILGMIAKLQEKEPVASTSPGEGAASKSPDEDYQPLIYYS